MTSNQAAPKTVVLSHNWAKGDKSLMEELIQKIRIQEFGASKGWCHSLPYSCHQNHNPPKVCEFHSEGVSVVTLEAKKSKFLFGKSADFEIKGLLKGHLKRGEEGPNRW
mmetsp:Transcript_38588/g.78713  ORF Transcript_38588/g.78713 Transcript_38588/m.78713 type:complete len:109 (+) Transcript_38588:915-1241(+)